MTIQGGANAAWWPTQSAGTLNYQNGQGATTPTGPVAERPRLRPLGPQGAVGPAPVAMTIHHEPARATATGIFQVAGATFGGLVLGLTFGGPAGGVAGAALGALAGTGAALKKEP